MPYPLTDEKTSKRNKIIIAVVAIIVIIVVVILILYFTFRKDNNDPDGGTLLSTPYHEDKNNNIDLKDCPQPRDGIPKGVDNNELESFTLDTNTDNNFIEENNDLTQKDLDREEKHFSIISDTPNSIETYNDDEDDEIKIERDNSGDDFSPLD